MIALFRMECASWTALFSHIGYACQMTRATSINDNLINKRGTFDDSQVSMTKADIIVGQKSGLSLAGPATTAIEKQSMYANNTSETFLISLKIHLHF